MCNKNVCKFTGAFFAALWVLVFMGPISVSAHQTTLDLTVGSLPEWTTEEGLTFARAVDRSGSSTARGIIGGTLSLTEDLWIYILGGSYAHWQFSRGTATLESYSGVTYSAFYETASYYDLDNPWQNTWGMVYGDLQGTLRYDHALPENERTWVNVTSINGEQTWGRIDMDDVHFTENPDILTGSVQHRNVARNGIATGYYNGNYSDEFTTLILSDIIGGGEGINEGLTFGTYASDLGDGNLWTHFSLNSEEAHKGMLDGVLP